MKKIFAGTPHTKFIAATAALTWAIAMANSAGAAQLQEARVTQVVNDVKLLLEQSAPRPAAISDLIRHGTAIRTGTQSRSELTFADLTITRLGANTIFSFKEGTREMTLIDGAILFQVPKGSGGATIRTVGVTAAITGTTGIAEFHPATSSHPQLSKWLCLEGTFHLYLPNGQSVELGPGKIVTADGKSFSKVSTFDIAKLTSTSLFFTGFDQPLASMNLIMLESQNQVAGTLLADTTNPLDPTRIVNVTSQAIVAEETPSPPVSPTVSPTVPPPPPTPSKFGTPSVISSPARYLITNGTVITTDPSITTNGVTDYGKIYRGQTDDGPFSLWAFGSTSTFDTALRIDDTFFADPSHLPIAVFKFERLSLTGDPTIDTTNGVSKLGLIGVDGITSGRPGGPLTFTGLDLLLLATVNGSINLTSNVSFQDLHELTIYARGAGSDLTINSPISNIAILGLVAEDSLHLTNRGTMSVGKLDAIAGGDLVLHIGGSLLLNGRVRLDAIVLPSASLVSGSNLTLNVAGDYTNNSATDSSRLTITNRDHIGTGGNIGVNIGSDLTAMNDFSLVVQNAKGQIDNGGNLNLAVGGTTSTTNLDEGVDNSNGGTIGDGGNVTLHTVGPVTLDGGFSLETDNFNGGTINNGANVTAHFVGNVTATLGDFHSFNFFVVNGGNDFVGDLGGGTIGTGGSIDATFDGNAATTPTATSGSLAAEIANDHGNIGTGGNISVTIGGNLTCGPLFVYTSNRYGGQIGTGGNVTLDVAGNVASAGDAFIGVLNNDGGTIGSATAINVTAANISTGGYLDAEIDNFNSGGSATGGSIGGNAAINLNISDTVSSGGTAFFQIRNESLVTGSPGGHIGGDATLDITVGGDFSTAGNLFARIYNNGGGFIGGDARINFAANTISTGGSDQFPFAIQNLNGGHIVGDADIELVVPEGITGNSFATSIDNHNGGMVDSNALINVSVGDTNLQGTAIFAITSQGGGSIGSSASVTLNLTGNLTTQADAFIQILNFDDGSGSGPGTIGSNATLNVRAANISTGGNLDAEIGNFSGGNIGGDAAINMTANNISTGGSLFADIFNYSGGSIGGGAMIDVTAANITANSLVVEIDNTGGSIGASTEASAAINTNVSGTATVTNDATFQILGSDGATSAAININGGNYNVGGTFLSYIDGNGTITFSNASAHADVLKAGVFGANGVLNIGGGTLSADSTLKLYAPGSNGQLNFISNVTLGGNSLKILAANSITIFNNVVVTIGGSKPADVYTGFTDEIPNANYTGFGGNKSTTGTFAGAGANDPQPLTNAPPFGSASSLKVKTGGNVTSGKKAGNVINVRSSDELLALLDRAAPGPGGKITIPASKNTNNLRNSSRIAAANRLDAGNRLNVNRRAMDMRSASSSVMRHSPQ